MIIYMIHQSWLLLAFGLIFNYNIYPTWLNMLHLTFFRKFLTILKEVSKKDIKKQFWAFIPSKVNVLKRAKLFVKLFFCKTVNFVIFILKVAVYFLPSFTGVECSVCSASGHWLSVERLFPYFNLQSLTTLPRNFSVRGNRENGAVAGMECRGKKVDFFN